MKRSEINKILSNAKEFIGKQGYILPPFVFWSPDDWKQKGTEYDQIRKNHLGWDITDFGSGDFESVGLTLITVRNGNLEIPEEKKDYAEKIMISAENQVTPMHFHWSKMEDIVNRGGGNLAVKVYNATKDEKLADTDVDVQVDGRCFTVPAGTVLSLKPGESITVTPYLYHSFWGEEGSGDVLIGEVSRVNDDNADNRFLEPAGRFPDIEEDEAPIHLLCNEYPGSGD